VSGTWEFFEWHWHPRYWSLTFVVGVGKWGARSPLEITAQVQIGPCGFRLYLSLGGSE
jgi:hypothetical protein